MGRHTVRGIFFLSTAGSLINFLPRFFWWQELTGMFWTLFCVLSLIFSVLLLSSAIFTSQTVNRAALVLNLVLFVGYTPQLIPAFSRNEASKLNTSVKVLLSEDPIANAGDADIAISGIRRGNLSIVSSDSVVEPALSSIGEDMPPVILAHVRIRNRPLTVAAFAIPPPFSSDSVFAGDVIIRRMGTLLRYLQGPVLAVSISRNAPFSRTYSVFLHVSRLQDMEQGLSRVWDRGFRLPFSPCIGVFTRGIREISTRRIEKGVAVQFDLPDVHSFGP